MAGERRREPRFLARTVNAHVNGIACSIVDISRTTVRLSRPAALVIDHGPLRLSLAYSLAGSGNFVEMDARVVRLEPSFMVLKFIPPHERWQDDLRALDAAEPTKTEAPTI